MSKADHSRGARSGIGGKLVIRAFESRDAEAVLRLAEELRRFESGLYPRMRNARRLGQWYIDDLAADCIEGDGRILVAQLGGIVVGYVCARARVTDEARDRSQITYAMIDDLVVTADSRGRGIGTGLVEAAEAFVRSRGARWVRIGVLASNGDAYRIYRRAGFDDHLALLEKDLGAEA